MPSVLYCEPWQGHLNLFSACKVCQRLCVCACACMHPCHANLLLLLLPLPHWLRAVAL